jgi:hypothetical protein
MYRITRTLLTTAKASWVKSTKFRQMPQPDKFKIRNKNYYKYLV